VYSYFGGVVAISVLFWMAWAVWVKKIPSMSSASWFMWTILDGILTWTSYSAAPSELGWFLPFGWTVGAALCTFVTFFRGVWIWGLRETICALAVSVAVYFWLTISAFAGVISGTIALTVAGIPAAVDMFRVPIRGTFPVWIATAIACIFTLLGSDGTLVGVFLPAGSLIYNLIVAGFVLRKTPT
jgi:hypothetical protein